MEPTSPLLRSRFWVRFARNWPPLSEWQIVPSGERNAIALRIAARARDDFMRVSMEPELTVLVPRTRAAELSQYLTHLSRYRGRNDMLHALDRDHPVLYPGKLLHKLLHRHTSRFLNMP